MVVANSAPKAPLWARLRAWLHANWMIGGLLGGVLVGLFLVSRVNYLLFHSLAELFSVVIAFTTCVLTWNSRSYLRSSYLLVLGLSFLFVGGFDLLHTLAFSGMAIFPGTQAGRPDSANLGTQLWLAARYLQAITLVAAPFYMRRSVHVRWVLGTLLLLSGLLLLLIFVWDIFPDAYVGQMTDFKLGSEYAIILLYLTGLLLLERSWSVLDAQVHNLLVGSIIFSVLSEVAFTGYLDVTDLMNLFGHFLKIVAFYLVYKAIIEIGFRQPQKLLFHELQQSEARESARVAQLEAIMNAVPALVRIAHDAQAQQVTSNRSALDLFGSQAGPDWPANTAHPYRVFDEDGQELHTVDYPLQRAASSGQPVRDFEEQLLFEDGKRMYLYGNAVPLFDERGLPAGAVSTLIDITGRVLAEQALQESEQRYRGLFTSMAEAFALYQVVLDGQGNPLDYRFMDANPAFERLTGLRCDEVIGKTMRELAPGINPPWIEQYDQVTRSGETLRFDDYSPMFNKYFEVLVYRAGDLQVAVLSVDVSERRRSQEALRQSEARLRRLFEANIIGIQYTDAQGLVATANDSFLDTVGYTRADLAAGQVNWYNMTPPEYLALDEKNIAEALRLGACTPYEKEYIRKDGTRVPILIGYAYFAGDLAPFTCFILDLTEQKAAEAAVREYAGRLESSNLDLERAVGELERANRELQEFAFVASHDLQEPLRKIQAFGERIRVNVKDQLDPESRDYLERMLNAANRMRTMINDLLTLSRVTTRAHPFEAVDLNEVAAEVLSDLEMRIERSGAQVQVGPLPVIEADPTQMHQLLQNLIGNALKFQRPEQPPVVRVYNNFAPDKRFATITVEDNGIGFEEQYQDRIFQPFQRLHGAGQYEGSGMGLAICRKIVERHAGKIDVYSTPGQGSKFIVMLPVKEARQPKKVVS